MSKETLENLMVPDVHHRGVPHGHGATSTYSAARVQEIIAAVRQDIAIAERGPIFTTAIDALNKVKAWRDCDGNDGFPHDVREQIDVVLMAFELRQKEIRAAAQKVKP